jgi:hypothetical protein
MMRHFKALGLALAAVLAMSAMASAAAQAAPAELTAEKYPVTLTGEQVTTPPLNELVIGNGARRVSCTTANLHGTIAGPTTVITLTPTYNGCTSTGGLPATVTMKGCDFTLSGNTATASTGTLSANVVCTAPNEITVDIYATPAKHTANERACEYHIKPQGPLNAGEYHNLGAGTTRDIEATLKVENIHTVNTVGTKLLCGLAAGETGFSSLIGSVTLKGEVDSTFEHIGIFIS